MYVFMIVRISIRSHNTRALYLISTNSNIYLGCATIILNATIPFAPFETKLVNILAARYH